MAFMPLGAGVTGSASAVTCAGTAVAVKLEKVMVGITCSAWQPARKTAMDKVQISFSVCFSL